jgi:hypothetical protein
VPSDDLVITTVHGNPHSIRELVVSYLRAVERFRGEDLQASAPGDHQLAAESRGSSALAEALNWADMIDQWLGCGPDGDRQWMALHSEPEQQVMRAFQRVRNVVHHRWWNAVATRMVILDGRQANTWVWAPLPDSRRHGRGKDKAGDCAFATTLKGDRVLDTLDELAGIFWDKRGWVITREDLEQPGYEVRTPVVLDVGQEPIADPT